MDCYVCLNENVKISSAGICVECSQGVCTKPSSRVDHKYHGERCVCGCRKLVCISDMDDHSKRAHGGSVPTCFPAISMADSARTVATALSLPNLQTPEDHSKANTTLNDFLNYIRPGHNVLANFRKDIPREYWGTRELLGKPARIGVFFRDSFFQNTATRVASVAVRTLGDIFRTVDMAPITNRLDISTTKLVSLIEAQSTLSADNREVLIGSKEIKDAAEQLHLLLPSEEIVESLPLIPSALDDEALAAWLFELDLVS